jgi:hypothetical protein
MTQQQPSNHPTTSNVSDHSDDSNLTANGNRSNPFRWILFALGLCIIGPILTLVFIVSALTLVAALGSQIDEDRQATQANEPPVSAQPVATVSSSKKWLQFDDQPYTLEFASHDETSGSVNEYVPEGETLEKWTRLIGVRQQPINAQPIEMAKKAIEALKEMSPGSPYTIRPSEDGSSCSIDFAIWQGDVAEVNVFVYRRSKDGHGITSFQYAERAYGDEKTAFLENLRDRIDELSQKANDFEPPTLIPITPSV